MTAENPPHKEEVSHASHNPHRDTLIGSCFGPDDRSHYRSFFGADSASSADAPGAPNGAAQPAGDESIIQGDINCDGVVDGLDALGDLRFVGGLDVEQEEPCPDVGTLAAIPGPQGDQGEQGPPGLSNLQVVTTDSESNSNDFKFEDASCPAGTQLIAGGTEIRGIASVTATTHLIYSYPIASIEETWRGGAKEHGAGTPNDWRLFVYAFCANVAQ